MTRTFLFAVTVLLVLVGVLGDPCAAQTADHEAIRGTIEKLFDGMREEDSSAVRDVFHKAAGLHTAIGPSDTSAVQSTSVRTFKQAVGETHEKVWDERIWDVEIRIDGPLASAWVPYAFYHGDELSHCGVNAMQFVRTADGWKIYQLTDSRRTDCEVPEDVEK